VFNRWGQVVYTTANRDAGWDGTINGINQPVGVYVWMLKAKDVVGQVYDMKGTFLIIR
jgi:gliding motility-associated-like protein